MNDIPKDEHDGQPSRNRSGARWCVASLADGQTHLANQVDGALVTARCDGKQFRPLATLTGTPPDPAQTCPTCREIRS
ncbi:MAG: hypothetical protein ACT4NY_20970 [Pseudonocardiales bacterium]